MKFVLGALAALAFWCPQMVLAQNLPVATVRQMQDLAQTGQAAAFSQMIQTAITSTGKFRVIESNFADLRDQQELGNSGMVTTNRKGKRGGFEGADFLIYGTITAGSAARQSDDGADFGRALAGRMFGVQMGGNCSKSIATLAVDIKIVDGSTGEIRYAKNINQTTASRTTCSGDAQVDLANMLRGIANQIAGGLVTTVYPIKVAAVQGDGTLMLNYGEGTVVAGTRLNIFAKGEKIIDPDTGKVLSDEGALIGTVLVTEVTPKFSRAAPEGSFAQAPAVGYIARIAPPRVAAPKGKRK